MTGHDAHAAGPNGAVPPACPPLAGIKVLDLSRVLAGPWCTMMLADLGAEVWKVEHPGRGDDSRGWAPPEAGGESTYYLSANRNKHGLAVDLKHPQGQDIVRALADRADVLVENMRLGTMERLGLGYETLAASNPGLVYCSISGYGRNSPLAALPGYDLLIQAESGLMSLTGEADGPPLKFGVPIADLITGMNASQAILAALLARQHLGQGQWLDMALFDGALAATATVASGYLNTGIAPGRYGNAHPTVVPYQAFVASDQPFILACGNDGQFRNLCEQVIDRPELASDGRFARNRDRVVHRDELVAILEPIFAADTATQWVARLQKAGIPAGVVRTLPEVLASPEVAGRGLLDEMPHATAGQLRLPACPLRVSGVHRPPRPPPRLGEHTALVLGRELGLDAARIAELVASGAIALAPESHAGP